LLAAAVTEVTMIYLEWGHFPLWAVVFWAVVAWFNVWHTWFILKPFYENPSYPISLLRLELNSLVKID